MPSRFGGGGVVAEMFRDLQMPTTFAGGPGSARNFFPVPAGQDQSNSLNSGKFGSISDSKVTFPIQRT